MMSNAKTIRCQTFDGKTIEYVDEIFGSGAMKDVYFSPDKSYVMCFFSKEKNKFYDVPADLEQQKDRLKEIVGNKWHANNMIAPNERLSAAQTKRVGYFVYHQNVWWLVNEGLPDLMDADSKTAVPMGSKIELTDGKKILLSREEGGRLVVVQMVSCP